MKFAVASAIILGCAVFLILTGSMLAWAHQSESGWQFPIACCSNKDCYAISETDLRLGRDGSFTIVSTGEQFFHPDDPTAPPTARRFQWSGDAGWYRCSPTGQASDSLSFCLFIPAPGV